jgi:flagellar hook-associated protein 3 FlgL
MSLRITEGRMYRSMSGLLGSAMSRIDNLQHQAATGRRFANPSEDPLATMQAQALQSRMTDNQRYQNNAADALSWNSATEPVVATIHELLAKMQETILRGGDEAVHDRTTLATTVNDLLEEMVSQANTRSGDRYLFAGFADRTAPYATSTEVSGETVHLAAIGSSADLQNAQLVSGSVVLTDPASGTTYTEGVDYQVDAATGRVQVLAGGSLNPGQDVLARYRTTTVSSVHATGTLSGDIVRQIGTDRSTVVNLTGPQVFAAGGDLFQLAIDLKNALWKNDAAQVRALGTQLEQAMAHVSGVLGLVGSRTAELESQQKMLESDATALETYLADVRDADLAQVMMRLTAEQNAYQAALTATARVMQSSLASKL